MSRRWYLLSLLPLVAGIMIAVLSVVSLFSNVKGMQRLVAPGERELSLAPGHYLVFREKESVVEGKGYQSDRGAVRCTLSDAHGTPVALDTPKATQTYSLGDYAGRSMFTAAITTSGSYKLACQTATGQHVVVAVGHGFGVTLVISLVSVFAGAGGAVVAFVLIWRKRKKAARQATQATTGS